MFEDTGLCCKCDKIEYLAPPICVTCSEALDKLFDEMARLIMDYPGGHTNLPPDEYKAGLVRWCIAREAVVYKLEEK